MLVYRLDANWIIVRVSPWTTALGGRVEIMTYPDVNREPFEHLIYTGG